MQSLASPSGSRLAFYGVVALVFLAAPYQWWAFGFFAVVWTALAGSFLLHGEKEAALRLGTAILVLALAATVAGLPASISLTFLAIAFAVKFWYRRRGKRHSERRPDTRLGPGVRPTMLADPAYREADRMTRSLLAARKAARRREYAREVAEEVIRRQRAEGLMLPVAEVVAPGGDLMPQAVPTPGPSSTSPEPETYTGRPSRFRRLS